MIPHFASDMYEVMTALSTLLTSWIGLGVKTLFLEVHPFITVRKVRRLKRR